ncbi:hypothetical protein MNV49_004844 [Pseudohyphozyma bogoriensis]|nr:hypothetical protein MNV49_004844 [Pseudohyphozyma bogoriensis]
MSSSRTQISYLSPALSTAPPAPLKGKLKRQPKDTGGNVLPTYTTGYGAAAARMTNGERDKSFGGTRLLAAAKERREERKLEGHRGGKSRINTGVVDEDGVAHDSEYVQFRTATPVHMHAQRHQSAFPDDDGSASSSSSDGSDSDGSGFPSTPYTYQSTHRTGTSSHHHYSTQLGTTGSAIPSYLNPTPHRSSMEYGSSLTVPRAPSPRRASADYERAERKPSSSSRRPQPQFTTSSYQPPAPAFNPRAAGGFAPEPTLRLPTMAPPSSTDSNSLSDSVAKLAISGEGTTGYNKLESIRAPKMDGSALAAGTHGLKRSWDGFKLETKFGLRSATKKVERKLRAI